MLVWRKKTHRNCVFVPTHQTRWPPQFCKPHKYIYLSVCLSIYLFIYLSIHPSIHLPIYLSHIIDHLVVPQLSYRTSHMNLNHPKSMLAGQVWLISHHFPLLFIGKSSMANPILFSFGHSIKSGVVHKTVPWVHRPLNIQKAMEHDQRNRWFTMIYTWAL